MIWRVGVFSQSWLTHHELLSGHFSPSCQVFGDSHEPACQLIYCRFFPRSCCIFLLLLLQKDTLFIHFPNTFLYIFHIRIAPACFFFVFFLKKPLPSVLQDTKDLFFLSSFVPPWVASTGCWMLCYVDSSSLRYWARCALTRVVYPASHLMLLPLLLLQT